MAAPSDLVDRALHQTLRESLHATWAAPLATAFGAGVALRRWAYDRGLRPTAAGPLRVLSVGGLEAGGSGKTPLAGLLLAALVARGVRCGLLTRGYGRARRGLVVRGVGAPADPASLGDEAAMLVAAGCDVAVAACADRRRGAAALAELGCEVAVMDDGFVHRRLRRDLDVVVLRAEAPLGDGRYLPWGSLREAPRALCRADAVVLYGGVGPLAGWPEAATRARVHAALRDALPAGRDLADVDFAASVAANAKDARTVAERAGAGAAMAGAAPPLALGWARAELRPADVAFAPHGDRTVAAAGIARPPQFFAALRAAGVHLLATRAFCDHHAFTAADVAALRALARRHGASAVAVTAKDAIKLAPLWPPRGPALWPWVLDVSARLPAVVTGHLGPGGLAGRSSALI